MPPPARKNLFSEDVAVEDVDENPFEKFGNFGDGAQPKSQKSLTSHASKHSGLFAAPTSTTQKKGESSQATSGTAANVADPGKAPGTSNAATRRLMLINTELAVGHEKTLQSMADKKTDIAMKGSSMFSASSTVSKHSSAGDDELEGRSSELELKKKGTLSAMAAQVQATDQGRQIPRVSTLRTINKVTKSWFRLSRTLYQWCCMFSAILAFACAATICASGYWIVRKDTLNSLSSWEELTTYAGACSCHTTLDFACSTLNNSFQQVSMLSGILIGVEIVLIGTFLFEFSFYGIFGGTHFFTRLSLILEVLGFATAVLSLTTYSMAYQTPYCDFASFQTLGYLLNWGAYMRAAEALGFLVVMSITGQTAFGTSRGPPCMLLFVASLVLCMSCVSTTSRQWMVKLSAVPGGADTLYGITSYCTCGVTCSTRTEFQALLGSTQGISAFQAILGLLTVFFTLLRGVDNAGATLKFAEITGFLFIFVAMGNVANLYRMNFSASCNIAGQEDNYVPSWSLYVCAGSCGIMIVFVTLNGLYMSRIFVKLIEAYILDHLPADSPWAPFLEARRKLRERKQSLPSYSNQFIKSTAQATAAREEEDELLNEGPFASVGHRSFYQVFWWDELMSEAAMTAEEIDDALNEAEQRLAKSGAGEEKRRRSSVGDAVVSFSATAEKPGSANPGAEVADDIEMQDIT